MSRPHNVDLVVDLVSSLLVAASNVGSLEAELVTNV